MSLEELFKEISPRTRLYLYIASTFVLAMPFVGTIVFIGILLAKFVAVWAGITVFTLAAFMFILAVLSLRDEWRKYSNNKV